MNIELVVAIVGAFGTLALSINAYFLKAISNDINTVKIELAKLSTEHTLVSKLVEKHDGEIDKIRERLHKVEGMESQLISFLKENRVGGN